MLLFTDVHLGAAEFAAMPPALRTEAVLLAFERGMKPSAFAKAVERPISEILQASAETHAVRLHPQCAEQEVDAPPASTEVVAPVRLPRKTASAVLRLIVEAGGKGLAASADTLSRTLGVGSRHVNASMNRLIADELIYRLRPPHGTSPTVWAATEVGKAAHAELIQRGEV